MDKQRFMDRWFRPCRLILIIAVLVRFALVMGGGQRYFPDEKRYFISAQFLEMMWKEGASEAFRCGLGPAYHVGFTFLGTITSAAHYLSISVWSILSDSVERLQFSSTLWISAWMLSMASVSSIALAAAISRRLYGDRNTATSAALLMTCLASMAVYARHLLPYDSSMAFALLALWVGLSPNHENPSARRSIACGLAASMAFLTYHGYWTMTGAVLLFHVFYGGFSTWENRLLLLRRGLYAAIGFLLPITFLQIALRHLGDIHFLYVLLGSSTLISQGEFHEGWSLPWKYLWHAEHGLLIALLVLGAAAVAENPTVPIRKKDRQRAGLMLAMAGGIYFSLAILSVSLHIFVLYGRLARQVVPFLVIAASPALAAVFRRRIHMGYLTVFLLLAQACFNLAQPLTQKFPYDIKRETQRSYGDIRRMISVTGPEVKPAPNESCLDPSLLLINAEYLYPMIGVAESLPKGRILFEVLHPIMYFPYQYEGLRSEEREIARSLDISISLLRADAYETARHCDDRTDDSDRSAMK